LKYIGSYAFSYAGTADTELKTVYIHKGVELGQLGDVYGTFNNGYTHVTELHIGANHRYGDDTSALTKDLFNSNKTITVSILE
jgi:hypothetical protein